MIPRILPPIGTKKDCAVEIAFYDTVTTVCFIVCFQKLFLRVFFPFLKLCFVIYCCVFIFGLKCVGIK